MNRLCILLILLAFCNTADAQGKKTAKKHGLRSVMVVDHENGKEIPVEKKLFDKANRLQGIPFLRFDRSNCDSRCN